MPTYANCCARKSLTNARQEEDRQRPRAAKTPTLMRSRPLHTRLVTGLPKRPAGSHEQDDEDDQERHRQPQVGADEVDVAADQVQPDAEHEAADDGAERRVDPAEHRGRERVDQGGLHHVRVEEERRGGEHPRDRAEHRRQAPADREHPAHPDADEPARLRVERRRTQGEARSS